ncbi:MAG: hypothetical protein AB2693_33450, partial [Candidatus Thiodiazotropha sp.]
TFRVISPLFSTPMGVSILFGVKPTTKEQQGETNLSRVITKTLYRTAPHWGKIEYPTAKDFRTLLNFTISTVGKGYITKCILILPLSIYLTVFCTTKVSHL